MIEIIHEFIVRDGSREKFELVFGPGGAWSKLFASSAGFRGTTVMRGIEHPLQYVVVTSWDSAAEREDALNENPGVYAELEDVLDQLTTSRSIVGDFNLIGQASVRPRTGTSRNKPRRERRNNG
jgi:hypothetical protein